MIDIFGKKRIQELETEARKLRTENVRLDIELAQAKETLDRNANMSVAEMVAFYMQGTTLAELQEHIEDLPEADRKEYWRQANEMVKQPLFRKMDIWIEGLQMEKSMATDVQSIAHLNFERATIRGSNLYVDLVESLAKQYLALGIPEDKPDLGTMMS